MKNILKAYFKKTARHLCAGMILIFCILQTGCWNYRGLDQLGIATGIAVDRPDPNGPYCITIEMISTDTGSPAEGVKVIHLEMHGDTIFTAVRNGKRRASNKLYGGSIRTLIISKQVAQEEGVRDLLEQLYRDVEPRETISVIISQEDSARELFFVESIDTQIASYELHETVVEDKDTTDSTVDVPLYMTYRLLTEEGCTLVLPAVHTVRNIDDLINETNGIAYFKGDKLAGYLSPKQTAYFLFMVNKLESGAFSFSLRDDGSNPISTNVDVTRTNRSVRLEDGRIVFDFSLNFNVGIAEVKRQVNLEDMDERNNLEDIISLRVQENLIESFENMKDTGVDLFGLGHLLYESDPDVWFENKDNWDELIQTAVFNPEVRATIRSTGFIQNF